MSGLISAFIGRRLVVASLTANEPAIGDLRDRSIRFDVSCKAENGELVNIEMSLNPDLFEPVRLEYYTGRLFTRQDIKGKGRDYADLKYAYQIAILANRRFFEDEALVHTFKYYDEINKVSLGGRSEIITVELKKAELVINKPVKEMSANEAWAAFFQYLTDGEKREKINEILEKESGIAMAGEALITITQEEREWAWQLSREKYILDTQSKETQARREGRAIGHEEAALAIARNALANGLSIETVHKITGLDLETVKQMVNTKE